MIQEKVTRIMPLPTHWQNEKNKQLNDNQHETHPESIPPGADAVAWRS